MSGGLFAEVHALVAGRDPELAAEWQRFYRHFDGLFGGRRRELGNMREQRDVCAFFERLAEEVYEACWPERQERAYELDQWLEGLILAYANAQSCLPQAALLRDRGGPPRAGTGQAAPAPLSALLSERGALGAEASRR